MICNVSYCYPGRIRPAGLGKRRTLELCPAILVGNCRAAKSYILYGLRQLGNLVGRLLRRKSQLGNPAHPLRGARVPGPTAERDLPGTKPPMGYTIPQSPPPL